MLSGSTLLRHLAQFYCAIYICCSVGLLKPEDAVGSVGIKGILKPQFMITVKSRSNFQMLIRDISFLTFR